MWASRLADRFYFWLAWKLPRGLVKWAGIRMMANATVEHRNCHKTPSDVNVLDVLEAW